MKSGRLDPLTTKKQAENPAQPVDALRVGILLWPSFPLMSFAGLVESLRHAGDHGDDSNPRYARWDVIGPVNVAMRSSCGVAISPSSDYVAPSRFDHLFVIGGLLRDLDTAPSQHSAFIRAAHRAGVPVHGVCTGSFVLAGLGLLDGKSVCIHPYHREHFELAYPGFRFVPNRDFHRAGGVSTVLGGVSILSLMRQVIAQHLGPDKSAKVHHQMTLPAGDGSPDAVTPTDHSGIDDPRIQRALVILDAQSGQTPEIAALARMLGLSERHFLRLFRAHVGCSPKAYVIETKLRAAVWMLRNTRRSITSIAYATGFSSGANLADLCRRKLSATPGDIRRWAQAEKG
ncbi:helix-turn-helix domain-containing protein [Roseibaca sp. V10]|uniref:Helix-turn-helix domain-containing protein n=1 Tax=Roseinatronobacter domitianus TaxID=2940293 RepID=A0ABT0LXZ9_9RHOB|nr:helix-turn-helix domain-containing protein [Roseibaca domitiana]MCL1627497.1 helix-turn-helix domain-containing protein [Roseibaca domitiana]